MIRMSADTPITPAFISYCKKALDESNKRFKMLNDYFYNNNDINNRTFTDPSLPNNKLSHCFAKYISTISTAYFMGKGLKYEADDDEYNDLLKSVLKGNYFDSQNYEEAKEMSIAGISYELQYINTDGQYKTKYLEAEQLVPVFSDDIDNFLSCAVRFYATEGIDNVKTEYAEVYTKSERILFTGSNGIWSETVRASHLFDDVPVIIRRNNSQIKGDFEDVKSLIDGYDRSQSDTLNDLDYFTDAYLVVKGVNEVQEEMPDEDGTIIRKDGTCLKNRRTLYLPEEGEAEFLTKNINDTATENFKTRVYKDIFFLSMVPNLTDESFSGNLSGVAQKYKLFGLEALTAEKEKYWKSAEEKKLKFVTQYLNIKHGCSYDAKTVNISFDRSQIANKQEIAEIMNNLRDILSDETLIGMWPDVENASDELDKRNNELADKENSGTPPIEGSVY